MKQIFATLLLVFTSSAFAAEPAPVSLGPYNMPEYAPHHFSTSAIVRDEKTDQARTAVVWGRYFILEDFYAKREPITLYMAFHIEGRRWNVYDLGLKVTGATVAEAVGPCQVIGGSVDERGVEGEYRMILAELNDKKTALDIYLLRNLNHPEQTNKIHDEICLPETTPTRLRSIVPKAKPFLSIPLK